MFFLGYTTTWMALSKFRTSEKNRSVQVETNILHIIIIYIFFGCPILFIQIFIGQFTQKGCLVIGEMMPIAYGLGYFILLNTFVSCLLNIYHSVFLLYYVFIAAFNHPIPPWMICLNKYYNDTPNCIGLYKIEECEPCYSPLAKNESSCYDPKIHILSASLFFKYIVLEHDEKIQEEAFTLPSIKYFTHLLMTVAFTSVIIARTLRDLDGAVRIWNIFSMTSLTVMTTVVIFTWLRLNGLLYFFKISFKSIFSLRPWLDAISHIILHLKLFEGGNFLFGSYTPVTVNTGTRTSYLCIAHFLTFIGIDSFLCLLIDNFLCQINAKTWTLFDLAEEFYAFSLYPEALGLLAASPLWGALYFLIAFGVTIQTAALQVVILEASLSAEIINPSYYIYTRFLILLILFVCCFFLGTPPASDLIPYHVTYFNVFRIGAVFLFLCVVMLYGFQRLYDDVYFLLRIPPSFYYRLSWFMSLVSAAVSFLFTIAFGHYDERPEFMYFILSTMIFTLLVGFLVKFGKYLKAKDLMSLLRQAETWGPSDLEAKTDRRLFNPRYEVRFRRKVEKCKHRCLLNSSVLKKTLEKELALVSNVLLEIEDNEEDNKLKQREIENLRQHRACMSKFLAERAPEEIAFLFKKH